MDSRPAPAHRHSYEEDPRSTGLHAGEDEHQEKKSVLKKVKDKAKKLKDTLGTKMHGHGHHQDQDPEVHGHGHHHDHDPEVEEDDDEEEFEQVPDVRSSIYVYKSTVTQVVLTPHENKLEQSGDDLGPTPQFSPLEKDPQAPKDQFLPSDPGNFQTKSTDPTGTVGKEAGVTPLVSSFGNMEISNEPGEHKPLSSTESHVQFSSDLPPIKTQTAGKNFQAVPKSFNAGELEDYSQASTNVQELPNPSGYTEEISAATSTIAEKAISAKNVVASKLGYGGNDDTVEGGDATKSATVGEYGRKVAATVTDTLAPVYEKVAEAGSAVVSKMQGTGTGTATENEDGVVTDKGVSVKEYVVEKLKPSDEDKALSEVISEALHKRKGEEPEQVSQPQGMVTESPEVVRRLGSDNNDNTPEGMSLSNEVGKSMVDSLKGTVTSWFGHGEQQPPQQQTSQTSHSTSPVGSVEVGQDNLGERKLNESSRN